MVPTEQIYSNLQKDATKYNSLSLKFTQIQEVTKKISRLAARQTFSQNSNHKGTHKFYFVNLIAFDTELEKSIGIGLEWPFDPLKMDEGVISENLQLRLGPS